MASPKRTIAAGRRRSEFDTVSTPQRSPAAWTPHSNSNISPWKNNNFIPPAALSTLSPSRVREIHKQKSRTPSIEPLIRSYFKMDAKHTTPPGGSGSAKTRAARRVVDWLVAIACFAAAIALDRFISPRIHPIDLSDPRVRRPLLSEIVPTYALGIMALLLPAATFCVFEFLLLKRPRAFFAAFGAFFLGLGECGGFTLLFTGALKLAVGRPRPFFQTLCKAYVPGTLKCVGDGTAETAKKIIDARKSFPSGHSSISFTCFIYLALYMALRLKVHKPGTSLKTLKYLLLSIPVGIAAFVAVSRILDNHHNFDDVVAGSCLGTGIAVAVWMGRYREIEAYSSDYSQSDSEQALPMTSNDIETA